MADTSPNSETRRTDQDQTRKLDDGRVMPPTAPAKEAIREDRAALDVEHKADRMPTPDEERLAEAAGPVDPEVAQNIKDAIERGAHQEGEGRITP